MNLPLIKSFFVEAAQTPGSEIELGAPAAFASLGKINVSNLVSFLVTAVLIVASLVFFFILVISGIKWITAGGDENKVKAAKAQITNALIGLVIVFAAWAVINLLGTIFGIDLLKFTVPSIVQQSSS